MPRSWPALAGLVLMSAVAAGAADNLDRLRGPASLTEEGEPPRMAPVENRDLRRVRNYPEQPPTIPHKIEGDQIDYMDLTRQSPRAAQAHSTFLVSGERTCIDCHKGIAHELPDMTGVPGWQ